MAILAVVATIVIYRGCSTEPEPTQPPLEKLQALKLKPEEEVFLAQYGIIPHQYYKVMVDEDTAMVILKSIDGGKAYGEYFLCNNGGHCAEVWPLSCEIHKHKIEITLNGKVFVVAIKGALIAHYMDGALHNDVRIANKTHQFRITPYEVPAFHEVVDNRFDGHLVYKVKVTSDLEYAKVMGYWSQVLGYQDKGYLKVVHEHIKESRSRKELSLTMDIYEPENDKDQLDDSLMSKPGKRPLIVVLHGGAFYVGDKTSEHITTWSSNWAKMGYTVAAINYRLGFRPSKKEIEQAGYDAIEDAQKAITYLKQHADTYHIDTTRIFLAGTSAGSITALMTAFSDKRDYHIVAVANMWGAMSDLKLLKNSHTNIVSFHGTADQLVPYDQGTPFQDISKSLGKLLFNKLYGSASITREAQSLGYRTELHTFEGAPHAPIEKAGDHSLDWEYMNSIQSAIVRFFFNEMVPTTATIEERNDSPQHFQCTVKDWDYLQWEVPEGFILRQEGADVWIIWPSTASKHLIQCSGRFANGIGFRCGRVIL